MILAIRMREIAFNQGLSIRSFRRYPDFGASNLRWRIDRRQRGRLKSTVAFRR